MSANDAYTASGVLWDYSARDACRRHRPVIPLACRRSHAYELALQKPADPDTVPYEP
jgi:hypothetical protein